MARVYGIDPGTCTLKIYQKGTGIIYNQKNALAMINNEKIIATGDAAWDMEGRTPVNIEVLYPVRSGVLAQVKNMLAQLNIIFDKIGEEHGRLNGQDFLVACPTYATEVEKKAMVDLIAACDIKPRRIRVVDSPLAAALGAGVNLRECYGTMVVDIGADTTEIAVLSLGGTVASKMLNFGGYRLDDSIISSVRMYYNFAIGRKTAEQIKIALGTAVRPEEGEAVTKKAFGRDVVSGLPGSIAVDSLFVYLAIKDHIEKITEVILNLLLHIPPEMSADIMESGIILTGGVAGIKDLDKVIAEMTGLKVHRCDNGSETVALGLGKIAEDPDYDFLAEQYSMLKIED